ncbi:MarR family transcriptional regulator [Streptomyces smyrnaeus]|uniref:MarR family transcriptional regulator n=1 Tax=Streptomyces smyrnaeus TaxID=1387713 RepID=UPI0033AAD6D8
MAGDSVHCRTGDSGAKRTFGSPRPFRQRTTATSMIDRLEKRGLVRRVPHPVDRRAKVIQLTTEHSPFARLDHESRLRLHTLLREVIDGPLPTGETAGGKDTVQEKQQ